MNRSCSGQNPSLAKYGGSRLSCVRPVLHMHLSSPVPLAPKRRWIAILVSSRLHTFFVGSYCGYPVSSCFHSFFIASIPWPVPDKEGGSLSRFISLSLLLNLASYVPSPDDHSLPFERNIKGGSVTCVTIIIPFAIWQYGALVPIIPSTHVQKAK